MSRAYPPPRVRATAVDEHAALRIEYVLAQHSARSNVLDGLVEDAFRAAGYVAIEHEPPRCVRYGESGRMRDFAEAADEVNAAGVQAQARVLIAAYGARHAERLVDERVAQQLSAPRPMPH